MNPEVFRTLAEVSTGLSGFVGVVLAVRSRAEPLPRLQLVGFLQNSLGVLVFSLLPEFVAGVVGDPTVAMRMLCGVLAVYHLGIMGNYVRKQRGLLPMSPFQKAVTLLSLPVIALKACVALGFLLGHAGDIFYFGLLWHLGIAIYIFSQILLRETSGGAA